MKKLIVAGSVDQTIDVFISDSSSTTGAGKTGLAYNTASLVCYYRKGATGSATALALATQTVGGAHSDGGFVEIDATNMPGMYRLDLSDTIVASVGTVTLMLKGASGMAPCPIELQITGVDFGASQLPANVTQFGGTNGTFASGRPEVNTTHVAGTSQTAGDIIGDTNDIQARLPAALTAGGNIKADVLAWTAASITTDITGSLSGSVGSVAANGLSASSLAADAVAEIADGVWDEAIAGHLTAGSTGNALNSAGSAGDPWSTALPGAYGAGTAGKIIGDNLNATVSSRSTLAAADIRTAVGLASANLDTQLSGIATQITAVDDFVDTEVSAIKAKTDSLTFTVAGVVDANIQRINDVTITGNGSVGTEFGV